MVRMKTVTLVGTLLLTISALGAQAQRTAINFDDVPDGTVINNHYGGVVFSAPGSTGNGSVYARMYGRPTRSTIFQGVSLWPSPQMPAFDRRYGGVQATFAQPQSTVSIDVAPIPPPEYFPPLTNRPFIQAFDASGRFLGISYYQGDLVSQVGQFQTLTVYSAACDIKYVQFSSQYRNDGTAPVYGLFDNLAFESVVPAPVLQSLALSPNVITGNKNVTATVTLDRPAPHGGTKVALASNNAAVIPLSATAAVTVPEGATVKSISVHTLTVTANTTVGIQAKLGSVTRSASVTVVPAKLTSVSINPSAVRGGYAPNPVGTVTLSQAAPAGGYTVYLESNATFAATVPASVTVPSGHTTATFAVTTFPVSASKSVRVDATFGGTKLSDTVTVRP